MTTFQSYDPRTRSQQSQPKACEACYLRKVKCDMVEGEAICRNCLNHETECRPRTRKRKAVSVDHSAANNPTSAANSKRDRRESASTKQNKTDGDFEPGDGSQSNGEELLSPNAHLSRDESSDLAAPFLFIAHQNRLASSPGTTADAVPSSVDEFHNSSYMSRSAILGDDFPDIDHSHNDASVKPPQHKVSAVELQVLKLYHAFDLPELPLRQSLIEAYETNVSPWMPVVDTACLSAGSPSRDTSLLLLQAVVLVGALVRPDTCNKEMVDSFYHRVKALVNSGYERNALNILAALCLMQWYQAGPARDVSTDTPRYWISCALGIAQQIGLHCQPARRSSDYGLRRRIWWTLYVRDSIMAAAHGRPRMLNIEESNMDPPSVDDFDDPNDPRAPIFVNYVKIMGLLCDACKLVIRQPPYIPQERDEMVQRLLDWARNLPPALRLIHSDGSQRPYDFNLAQLHVPFMTAISILYRPRSIFSLTSTNAPSVVAANLSFRICQAIQLREQTRAMSSAFSFHLLVCATPHLSCLREEDLRAEANAALDALEIVLGTLGQVRPAAANNLRNVQLIRKSIDAQEQPAARMSRRASIRTKSEDLNLEPAVIELFSHYGPQAIHNLESVAGVLRQDETVIPERPTMPIPQHSGLTPLNGVNGQEQFPEQPVIPTAMPMDFDGFAQPQSDSFGPLFGPNFQDTIWMRNWIDDLQLVPEA